MTKKISIIIIGLLIGVYCGKILFTYITESKDKKNNIAAIISPLSSNQKQAIGFLPYWLLSSADKNYAKYLTTLTYFGLTIGPDGKIIQMTSPTESEPGWYSLKSGKVNSFLENAKKNKMQLSLLVFSSDQKTIDELISNPQINARNLIEEVTPVMQEYGFTDLNLDIESVVLASDSARKNFSSFVKIVKQFVDEKKLGTLTIDASPTVLVKNYLIDLNEIKNSVDQIVLMTYDYHYFNSYVTGPVAPLNGVETDSEFDTEVAIKVALNTIDRKKIILGIPLYGYEWESLGDTPRSAVLPGSGVAASNRRVEEFLANCSSCSAKLDLTAQESYLIYEDQQTSTYHQIFYPDNNSTVKKIQLADKDELGGIAVWALGYEGDTILEPLEKYR